jgi:signal transduction histidine kinase
MASLGVIAIILMSILAKNISSDGLVRVENVFNDSKKVQNIQQNLINPLFRLRELSLSLVMAPNDDYRKEIRRNLEPLVKKLDKEFAFQDDKINKIWKNYKKLVYTTNQYINDGFEEGAFTNANSVERKQFYILLEKLEKLQSKQLKNSQSTYAMAKNRYKDEQSLILIGAIIVIVLTLFFGFTIAKNIVHSIESVKSGLERFFDLLGRKIDKDESISINLTSKDEFGEMAKSINSHIDVLRKNLQKDLALIEDATSVVESLKKKDLHKRLIKDASSYELNRLKKVMNEMLDNLEQRIVLEIQERTKKEQLLIQQSKLASMGNMIGNIAHQWRQPLSELNAILMNLQIKNEHSDLSDEEFENGVQECEVILSHMSNTISDFQNFFKPSKTKCEFNLADECKNASFIIESSLKYNNINFIMQIEDECKVNGYPREFSQAVLNILSNAKDVLLEKKIENPMIKMSIKKGKNYAIVKIEDNAGGVKESIKDRIFEPYFTTKHAKQGTGIGLYMSKIIIEENMHGYLSVKNSKNGAIFSIKLGLI